jgi:hypothetical protein
LPVIIGVGQNRLHPVIRGPHGVSSRRTGCVVHVYDERSCLIVLYSCHGITKTSKEAPAAEAVIQSVDLLLDLSSFTATTVISPPEGT